jgi:aminodeoxyfutalosine synthase
MAALEGSIGWLEEIGSRLAAGGTLTRAEAERLFQTRDLIAIGMLADDARSRMNGDEVTFLRVLDVPAEGPLPLVPPDTGEVRITGLRPDEPHAEARVREVVAAAAKVPVSACALHELTADLARRLRAAGLSLVATAAVDRLVDWRLVEDVQRAGLGIARWTVQSYDPLPPLDLFEKAAALEEPRSFAPLPTAIDPSAPTTGYDDVKLVALARLLLPGVKSISIDWSLYGPKLAQVALTFGAADLDGVTAEQSAGNLLGPRRAVLEEVMRNIRAASRRPVQRDARFDPILAGPAAPPA